MRDTKHHACLDSQERSIILHSLVELKDQLVQQGRYTDCVDELIFKVTNAPIKKIKRLFNVFGGFTLNGGITSVGVK